MQTLCTRLKTDVITVVCYSPRPVPKAQNRKKAIVSEKERDS